MSVRPQFPVQMSWVTPAATLTRTAAIVQGDSRRTAAASGEEETLPPSRIDQDVRVLLNACVPSTVDRRDFVIERRVQHDEIAGRRTVLDPLRLAQRGRIEDRLESLRSGRHH